MMSIHSEEVMNTAEFPYRFQLRGAIVMVAFQLFTVLFLYLMSWNYELIKTSLTPMFWSVLFAVALHGPKTRMVQYLTEYDKRLKRTISPWISLGRKWRIPTCILAFFWRIVLFWKPILFDVKYHARKYSKTNLFANYSSSPSCGGTGTFSFNRMRSNSGQSQFGDDDMDSDLSDLSSDSNENFNADVGTQNTKDINVQNGNTDEPSTPLQSTKGSHDSLSKMNEMNRNQNRDSLRSTQSVTSKLTSSVRKVGKTLQRAEKRGEQVIGDSAQKVVKVGSWLMSPMGLFCSLFVALCAILLGSEVVDQLGLYVLFRSLFVLVGVVMGIGAIFVLIPTWSKNTYNTVVVVFLILTLICAGTLISGVLLFKIADEMTRFVRLMNEVVEHSEVFKDLHLDSYLNATSSKLLESLQIHLGPEMNEEMLSKILSNDHVNWTETFSTLFGGDDISNLSNTSTQTIDITLDDNDNGEKESAESESNGMDTDLATLKDGEEGLMAEIYKVLTFKTDFDMLRMIRKTITALFGEQQWLNAVMDVDVMKYMATAQEWGLDLPFIKNLFGYTQQLTALVSTNLFGIIGILLSFGSWIISLGLDFMVFLACLFYLLVESEELFDTINNIASVIPSSDSSSQLSNVSSTMHFVHRHFSVSGWNASSHQRSGDGDEPHFLLSLFKSIQDIFVVTFEIFLCHAFVTWFVEATSFFIQ